MPLFFLLSGFSLARSYGPRISAPEAKYQPNKFKLFSSGNWFSLENTTIFLNMIHFQNFGHSAKHPKNFLRYSSSKLV